MTSPEAANPGRQLGYLLAAAVVPVPALIVRLGALDPSHLVAALVFGGAVVGAAFVLAWSAEVVQLDISAGLALALLALVAVLPEYAVDFVFTAKAGNDPDQYAPLALANMTGGNQLLIGVGWPLVVLVALHRLRRAGRPPTDDDTAGPVGAVHLDRVHAIEIAFLALASLYGLTLPLRNQLGLWDAAVLVLLYVGYLARTARAPAEEPHLIGPSALIGALPVRRRRTINIAMLVYAAGVIFASAEPFAEALVDAGEEAGVSTFLLVKWVAPIASEAPELLVAGLFAWRLNSNDGLAALVSAKVNQWTLLVGTLPIVFAVSSSSWSGLPLGTQQRSELLVTAAQSAFAVAVLADRSISGRSARMLLALFVGQFAASWILPASVQTVARLVVGFVYLALAAVVVAAHRRHLRRVLDDGLRVPVAGLG